MLKVSKVFKAFGEKEVLKEVSFEAQPGEIIGLVAPNGTGKSTLLNIIMNFLTPDAGEVTILDKFGYRSKKQEIQMHQRLSFLPELNDLYEELSGYRHLTLYAKMWKGKVNDIDPIVNSLNMAHYVKKPVGTYSLGMCQRLAFAMLLAADTDIMLMDEVMNGLDPDNVTLITNELIELKKQGKVILIASHLLDNLDLYADRILFFKDGNILLETREDELEQINHTYIKIQLDRAEFDKLKGLKKFPDNTQYIAGKIVAIPLKSLEKSEISDWIQFFIDQDILNVTIGQIGTAEWYEEFYN